MNKIFTMDENEQPRWSNVTRPIQAAKAKGTEKISEVMTARIATRQKQKWRKKQIQLQDILQQGSEQIKN